MYINFSDIPGHQNLFLDYLNEFENVHGFYLKNFRDFESYEELFKTLSQEDKSHRAQLADIIRAQYIDTKISKQTQNNIESLYSKKTIAVITGQQLGLFGGPLYTIYKSLTAIKLCNFLKSKYDAYNFVPIFWLEGDDHDYDEVRTVGLVDTNNQLFNLSYVDGEPDEFNRGCIGLLKFNQNINNVFNDVTSQLRDTEFKNQSTDFLKSNYSAGRTFLESFRDLMIGLFDEYGLIVFNPLDTAVKRLLIPIFHKEITLYRDHTSDLVERSAELEESYHAQVKVKPVNLFYLDENERLLIEPVENEFRLKGKRKRFTQDDLLAQLNYSPERFSPNVLLRPICQDYLFPTGFYIGGPSEVSYFAQVTPLYKIYNITQPFIYPRSSATIIEKGVKTILDKHQLSFIDIFSSEDEIITKILAANASTDINKTFHDSISSIDKAFIQIAQHLSGIDKTLGELSLKSKEKVIQTVDYLKSRAIESEKKRNETTIRQLGKVKNVLYPNNNLQERELNFIYFINKYGMDFIKFIYGELTINKFEHQVIEI